MSERASRSKRLAAENQSTDKSINRHSALPERKANVARDHRNEHTIIEGLIRIALRNDDAQSGQQNHIEYSVKIRMVKSKAIKKLCL